MFIVGSGHLDLLWSVILPSLIVASYSQWGLSAPEFSNIPLEYTVIITSRRTFNS